MLTNHPLYNIRFEDVLNNCLTELLETHIFYETVKIVCQCWDSYIQQMECDKNPVICPQGYKVVTLSSRSGEHTIQRGLAMTPLSI